MTCGYAKAVDGINTVRPGNRTGSKTVETGTLGHARQHEQFIASCPEDERPFRRRGKVTPQMRLSECTASAKFSGRGVRHAQPCGEVSQSDLGQRKIDVQVPAKT